jgi:hypothetical protein
MALPSGGRTAAICKFAELLFRVCSTNDTAEPLGSFPYYATTASPAIFES